MISILLYAAACVAAGSAVGLGVYAWRKGRLARLFQALPAQARRKLIAKPSLLKLHGETRTITYLSCRIANAQEIEPALRAFPTQLIALFDKRLGALYEAVLAHGGTVERLGATGFAAYWNAPLDDNEHATRALAAAIEAMKAVRAQNAEPAMHRSIAAPPVQIAVGLATGPAAAGVFGGIYSVSGACVERAEELRGACADYGFTALADGETATQAQQFALLEIGTAVREACDASSTYALMGDAGVRASPTFRAAAIYHERIFAAVEAHDQKEAARLISQASQLSGASAKLYEIYRKRFLHEPLRQAS